MLYYVDLDLHSFRILAEVNTLPLVDSTGPQQWKRLFHGLVPVTLSCMQVHIE